jgi:hypothetical protein
VKKLVLLKIKMANVTFLRLGRDIQSTSRTIVEDTNIAIVLSLCQINCRFNTDLPSFASAVEALQIKFIRSKRQLYINNRLLIESIGPSQEMNEKDENPPWMALVEEVVPRLL